MTDRGQQNVTRGGRERGGMKLLMCSTLKLLEITLRHHSATVVLSNNYILGEILNQHLTAITVEETSSVVPIICVH